MAVVGAEIRLKRPEGRDNGGRNAELLLDLSKTALFFAMRARPLSMRNFAAMRSENSRKLCEKMLCLRSLLTTFWSKVTPSSADKARGVMPLDRASDRNSESQRSKLPEFVHAAPSFAAAASRRLTKIADVRAFS